MPTEWSGNVEEYVVWTIVVVAFLKTWDKQWKTIAETVLGHENGNLSKKLVNDEQVEEFLKQHDINVSLKGHLLETLFTELLQYTGGNVKAMVNILGERGVCQALRWVHHKGTVLDGRQQIELGSKVLNPQKAGKVEDVEARVLPRKKKYLNKLLSIDKDEKAAVDRIKSYLTILPETVQDLLLNRGFNPKEWEDLDSVEVAVETYLKRWKHKTGA